MKRKKLLNKPVGDRFPQPWSAMHRYRYHCNTRPSHDLPFSVQKGRKGERRGQTRDKASSLRRVNLSITGGESTTMDKVVVGPVQGAFTDVDKWSDWS